MIRTRVRLDDTTNTLIVEQENGNNSGVFVAGNNRSFTAEYWKEAQLYAQQRYTRLNGGTEVVVEIFMNNQIW